MVDKTERELDIENLEKFVLKIADQLPEWRKSDKKEDKLLLAKYGRGCDLDKLVKDKDWQVRKAVIERSRDKDLDKLVNDPDADVRSIVALQGRNKDLDILVNDQDDEVREAVAWQGRPQDLDVLINDKSPTVSNMAALRRQSKEPTE